MNVLSKQIKRAAYFIEAKIGKEKPEIGLILGSGLGLFAQAIEDPIEIPYDMIPYFPISTVSGHAGRLLIGSLGGKRVMAMQGRSHFYEGNDIRQLGTPIRAMKLLGIQALIITNAAGAVNSNYNVGDLMLLRDHINFTSFNPLIGPNLDEFGPRFIDVSQIYSKELRKLAHGIADRHGITLREGVYQFMAGPTYETPAEVKMAQIIGADAVGMSTVPEAIVAGHCELPVLGISYISNMASGLSDEILSHDDVVDNIEKIKQNFALLLSGIVTEMKLPIAYKS